MTLVTSHYSEDLRWLRESPWPVCLVNKAGARPTWLGATWTIPNKGRECSVYTKYIVESYDSLPTWVAFIHGHRLAWHQYYSQPLFELVEMSKKTGFQGLNGYWMCRQPETYKRFWHVVEPWLGPLPDEPSCFDASAQFVVSADRIRRLPKEFYQKCFDFCMETTELEAAEFAIFAEGVWHYIFGEQWAMPVIPLTKILKPEEVELDLTPNCIY